MKKKSIRRGLYRRETVTPENDDEFWQALELLSNDLDRYISEAESVAADILRKENINPDTLFDVVNDDTGVYVRYARIDPDKLSADADSALQILQWCRTAKDRPAGNNYRDGIWLGIHLAQSVEHLKANRAWMKPVTSRKKSNKNLQRGSALTDNDILEVVREYRTRQDQARKLGISVRQLQRRLKKINSK